MGNPVSLILGFALAGVVQAVGSEMSCLLPNDSPALDRKAEPLSEGALRRSRVTSDVSLIT
jgi:hypothetical protein